MNLFDFDEYKAVLKASIDENRGQRAYKSCLAEAAGCQRSFFSQVLNSHVHLTPEHALGIARYWRLKPLEQEYFIELLNLARAGTRELQAFIRERLGAIQERSRDLGTRFRQAKLEDPAAAMRYYASWHFSAVHVLLTVPACRTAATVAARLGIPAATAARVLEELAEMGLARKKGAAWEPTQESLHLPSSSPLNALNHQNWRSRAVEAAFSRPDEGLHYTAVCSLSARDLDRLRDLIVRFIDETRAIIRASPEEELAVFSCDFFRV